MHQGMDQGIGSVTGEWAAPCAGKGCAAAWSPRCVPQAGKRAPSPPEAGKYLLCLPSLCSLPFLLGGGVLMRLCMPRVPSNWHCRGKIEQLMEEMMRLGGGILVLPAQLQCETPRLPAGLLVLPSLGAYAVISQRTEQGHSMGNVFRITHLGELCKQCQMFWH